MSSNSSLDSKESQGHDADSTPLYDFRWKALALLTCANVLNYIDRNIFAALGPKIKADLSLSDIEIGILGSAFIFAYSIVAPIFGYMGDKTARPRLVAIGLSLWSIATAITGLAQNFKTQLLARIGVGVGESAYGVVAPSLIAEFFPKASRGRVFSIYSGAIPIGSALGYLLGGLLEKNWGWKKAFFIVGTPGILIALLFVFLPDPRFDNAQSQDKEKFKKSIRERVRELLRRRWWRRRGHYSARSSSEDVESQMSAWDKVSQEMSERPPRSPRSILRVAQKLAGNGSFVYAVLGYSAYTAVVGGMAFWIPHYIERYFHVDSAHGNIVFGGITVVAGFLGTFIGGWLGDRFERTSGNGYMKVCVLGMLIASPLFAYTLMINDFNHFSVILFFMEVALFLCTSPIDAAVISFTPPLIRASAMAINVFVIHVLGDGISRIFIGGVSDVFHDLKLAIAFCPVFLIIAAVIWFLCMVFYGQAMVWPAAAKRLRQLPQFQSHRGLWRQSVDKSKSSQMLQENTLAAFRASRQAGFAMIELDVQLTADGEVIVFHDDDLKRLGGGLNVKVENLTAQEIQKQTGAPLLKEVLQDPDVPVFINIELKTKSVWSCPLAPAVAQVVLQCQASDRVLFSSFNPFALRHLAKLCPEIPRALLVTEEDEPENHIWLKKMWLCFWARPHLLHLDDEMLTQKRVEDYLLRGFQVGVWTVNNPKRAQELLSWGVHSVITDLNQAVLLEQGLEMKT